MNLKIVKDDNDNEPGDENYEYETTQPYELEDNEQYSNA